MHAQLTLAIPGRNWQASFFEHAAPAPCWPAYGRRPAVHMSSHSLKDRAFVGIPVQRALREKNVSCVGGVRRE